MQAMIQAMRKACSFAILAWRLSSAGVFYCLRCTIKVHAYEYVSIVLKVRAMKFACKAFSQTAKQVAPADTSNSSHQDLTPSMTICSTHSNSERREAAEEVRQSAPLIYPYFFPRLSWLLHSRHSSLQMILHQPKPPWPSSLNEWKSLLTIKLLLTCPFPFVYYAIFSMSLTKIAPIAQWKQSNISILARLLHGSTSMIESFHEEGLELLLSCHVFFQNADQIVSSIYRKNALKQLSDRLNVLGQAVWRIYRDGGP